MRAGRRVPIRAAVRGLRPQRAAAAGAAAVYNQAQANHQRDSMTRSMCTAALMAAFAAALPPLYAGAATATAPATAPGGIPAPAAHPASHPAPAHKPAAPIVAQTPAQALAGLAERYYDAQARFEPLEATFAGDNRFDDMLPMTHVPAARARPGPHQRRPPPEKPPVARQKNPATAPTTK
jgi:hypothetical protein